MVSNALNFDGVRDFVSIDSHQLLLTNNFSLSLWLKPQNAAGDEAFFSVSSSYQSSGLRFFVGWNSLVLQAETAAGYVGGTFATNQIQNGVWYHVALVYDNSTLAFT